jgi:hypothetical protein
MMHVISLGAGVQSTTMALMAAHGEITPMPDCAIFADTQAEPAAVYEHLKWLMSPNVLPFPVHIVTGGNLKTDIGRARKTGKFPIMPIPAYIKTHDGKEGGLKQRACTRDYKIAPLDRKVRELLGIRGKRSPLVPVVSRWIGISVDEAIRAKPSWVKWQEHRWPLLEKRMARHDCLLWLERNGYPKPPKSACTFCPFHDRKTWLSLTETEMKEAVEVDKTIRTLWTHQDKRAEFFLHPSLKPLDEVDFSDPNKDQIDLFNNECEGMCGV